MSEEIIIAIIGAAAVIVAALIGLLGKNKTGKRQATKIEQKIKNGTNNVQIGIQNNYVEDNEDKKNGQ